jgi:hypothetical protein
MYTSLALNYAMYWFIYRKPNTFKDIPQKDVIGTCYTFRIYQILSLIPTEELKLNINVLVFLLGQLLNMSVYYKLGNKGVYYGRELTSRKFPMIMSFPYNVVPFHPQYVGTLLSLISYMTMITNPLHLNYLKSWCIMVGLTILNES